MRRLFLSSKPSHHAVPRFVVPPHLLKTKFTPLDEDLGYGGCEVRVQIADLGLKPDTIEYLMLNEKKHLKRDGELLVLSTLPKLAADNKRFCLDKIQHILTHAIQETTARKDPSEPVQHQKDKWKAEKQHHKEIKNARASLLAGEDDADKEKFRPHNSRFGPLNEGPKF